MSGAVSEMDNLPNGWIASSVGQLYKIVGGGTPSTRVEKYWNGDISWISSADIHGLYDIRPRRKITLEAIKNSATNLVLAGSIIVVTRVGLGKIARTSMPLCFSQDSQALIGNVSFVNPDYMLYYLSQAVQSFKHAGRGTTISGVTKKQLSDLLLPVAPLNEQKRIVSKIESILAQIDGARTRLEVSSGMLNKLRSSVLRQAFEGRLVPQDPNDEPVEAILKRIRRASEKELVFEKDNLPNGWIASSVGQLYKIVGGGTPSTRVEKYWNGDISWISSADIRGLYDIRPRRKITPEAIKNSATNLVPAGSIIVVTRVGLGKIARTSMPLCFSQDSQALIGNVSFVNPDYMLYYLSQAVQSFKHASRGTTISGVTKKQLSDLLLPVAPPNEQKRIVSKIESIFTRIDAVERYIESTLRLLDLLKSSTFKQAFEGRLVPQDPDDEPAEFLLQIMKQEKQLIKSQKSSYGRKNVR